MKYNEFKNNNQHLPLIFSRDIMLHKDNKQIIRNQLKRWCEKRFLIKLKRGVFLLNANDRKIDPSKAYIANQLYKPSYASLEYALNYYGIIPERVNDITSITTKKTLLIKNELGTFSYQHINPAAFRGFNALKDEAGLVFFIAEPEKAIVDFCYLNMEKFQRNAEMVFEESYRLQNVETLRPEKVMNYTKLFNNDKLVRISMSLCKFIEENTEK